MKISKIFILATFALIFCFNASPGSCKNTVKIGSTTFISNESSVILTVTDDTITTSFGGTRGKRIVDVNLIFDGLSNQILEGAEFDVVTGLQSEKGKVTINVTDQFETLSGISRNFSTDSESKAKGKIKILTVDGNGGFTYSINSTVSNLLEIVPNPQTGLPENVRSPRKVRISGKIIVTKPEI